MQRWPWPWIAAGATLGCALTLGVQFTATQISGANTSAHAPQKPTTATVGIQGDPVMGSSSAPVTIVEFSDFECPYCKRFHDETLPKLKQHYINKGLVRLIHKDLPLPFHQHARLAATAARCAIEDGKYWQAYEALFDQQNCLDCKGPIAVAATTGINQDRLTSCIEEKRKEQDLNINNSEAELNDIRATPTFIIGPTSTRLHSGRIIEGAIPWERFQPIIEEALSNARTNNETPPLRRH